MVINLESELPGSKTEWEPEPLYLPIHRPPLPQEKKKEEKPRRVIIVPMFPDEEETTPLVPDGIKMSEFYR